MDRKTSSHLYMRQGIMLSSNLEAIAQNLKSERKNNSFLKAYGQDLIFANLR